MKTLLKVLSVVAFASVITTQSFATSAQMLNVSCVIKDGSKVVKSFKKVLTGESEDCGRAYATNWASQNFIVTANGMEDLSIQLGTQTDACMDPGPGMVVKVGGENLNLNEMQNLNDSYRSSAVFQSDNITEMNGATLFSWKGFSRDKQVLSLSCTVQAAK